MPRAARIRLRRQTASDVLRFTAASRDARGEMIMQRLVLCLVVAIGGVAVWETHPLAQAGRRANWLTDGGDPQRTVLATQRDADQSGDGQGHEAVVDAEAGQPAARDAQPVRAADHQRPAGGRRRARDRRRRGHLRQRLRHRRRDAANSSGSATSTARSTTTAAAAVRSVPAGRQPRRSQSRPTRPASTSSTRFRGTGGSARSIPQPARKSPAPSRSCLRMASPTR